MTNLLRSPPWPSVAPDITAIDVGHAFATDNRLGVRSVQAMAKQRVGGRFWGPQVRGRPRLIVLAPNEAMPTGDLANAVVVATDGRSQSRPGCDVLLVSRDTDPWPLIEAADEVVCARDGQIGTLALAAGKSVANIAGTLSNDEGGALFDLALVGRRYRDPITGNAIGVQEGLRSLAAGAC